MSAMLPVVIDTAIPIPPVVTDIAIPITLRDALETAADLASNENAPATRKAYASDFRIFERWCAEHGLAALPADPAAVAGFIADEASHGVKAHRESSLRTGSSARGTLPVSDLTTPDRGRRELEPCRRPMLQLSPRPRSRVFGGP
jgi:hypothetical protein